MHEKSLLRRENEKFATEHDRRNSQTKMLRLERSVAVSICSELVRPEPRDGSRKLAPTQV